MTFKPGQGGRMKGARNKISAAFLNDLLEEWSEGGREAMRIIRLERPSEFVKVVACIAEGTDRRGRTSTGNFG